MSNGVIAISTASLAIHLRPVLSPRIGRFPGRLELRKYVHLGFEDDRSMNYFGYDSMDDYYYGRASASGGFSRECLMGRS
jgi:hypothetical protein